MMISYTMPNIMPTLIHLQINNIITLVCDVYSVPNIKS